MAWKFLIVLLLLVMAGFHVASNRILYYGNNIGRPQYVVNLVKLFAYCCKNFQKCGPEDDGPARPAASHGPARPAGHVGPGLAARGPPGPCSSQKGAEEAEAKI